MDAPAGESWGVYKVLLQKTLYKKVRERGQVQDPGMCSFNMLILPFHYSRFPRMSCVLGNVTHGGINTASSFSSIASSLLVVVVNQHEW